MKSYKRMVALLIVLILLCMIRFAAVTKEYRISDISAVDLNNISRTAEEHWNDFSALEQISAQTPLLIFNSSSNLIFTSDPNGIMQGITSPEQAVSQGCLCLPVARHAQYLGTVILPDPDKTEYNRVRLRLISLTVELVILLILIMLIYSIYSYRNIVRPFGKLQDFAEKIAQGNLDQPLHLEKNNLFGAFTTSFDIMREELQNARSRETALKLKEKELIASLSHDLKTPIAGIQIICELLLVKLKDAYTIGKINEIHQKSMQISEMVNDLLTSSLDELGEMNVTLNDENAEILHEIVAANDPRQLVQDGSIPECLISVDKTRLRQAIGNIISNSYKYANTTIDIRYSLMDGYLKMAISDHGAGISADELPLVTNKFYRGKSFRNSGKEGSGLGLYIASELLNRMNGELICSSKEGEGLTVILLLPLS